MPELSKSPPAERLRKHRRGVARRLEDIQNAIDEMREDLHAVLATKREQAQDARRAS